MKIQNTARVLFTGAAMAGLLNGVTARVHAAQPGSNHTTLNLGQIADDSTAKHACKGQNDCKGKGGCKANDNGCKAKNDCKGKGGCATDGSKDSSK